ncbi:MAG: hypothetical protein GC134_04040 [Proteobacteria bacterium]|nr:hypothetical protein [Pseudomonadota bacterium]
MSTPKQYRKEATMWVYTALITVTATVAHLFVPAVAAWIWGLAGGIGIFALGLWGFKGSTLGDYHAYGATALAILCGGLIHAAIGGSFIALLIGVAVAIVMAALCESLARNP